MADDKRPAATPAPGGKVHGRRSVERAQALRDVLSHAVVVEKETRKAGGPRAPGSGRRAAIVLSVAGLGFCAFSLIVRPEFIWGPQQTALAPAERDANLRLSMFLLSQRIRSHRQATGHLPATLAELGAAAGVAYAILGDTVFQLTATEGGRPVVLRSDEPVASFLGDAPRRLRGAAR